MRVLLSMLLRRFVARGELTVYWPDGSTTRFAGDMPGRAAAVKLRNHATVCRLALHPDLAFGEAYMDGGLEPVGSDIYGLLDMLMDNYRSGASRTPVIAVRNAARVLKRRLDQFNPAHRSRRNVAHHYDLNGQLYALFLDVDRQYSCAYFPTGGETLEAAQAAKKRHIATKLLMDRPGLEVLDIGCGWGGMALTLARDYGARVTGITLSTEQLQAARARAAAEGLAERVSFELLDYRQMYRRFDRIVSVGMFEHVGVGHYDDFFAVVRRNLAPDGVALLHSIGRMGVPSATNPWINKYIFPGGYCPALSEVLPPVERSGLLTTDVEILRLHYAETLREWRQRFMRHRDSIAAMYDARFCRMFEFYLVSSELSFRHEALAIFQLQLTRQQRAVPLTRDYMYAPADEARPAAIAAE